MFPETGTASWLSPYLYPPTHHDDLGIGIRNVNFHVRIIHKLLLLDSKVEIIHLTTASLSGGRVVPGMSKGFHFWHSQPLYRVMPPWLANPRPSGTCHTDLPVEEYSGDGLCYFISIPNNCLFVVENNYVILHAFSRMHKRLQ